MRPKTFFQRELHIYGNVPQYFCDGTQFQGLLFLYVYTKTVIKKNNTLVSCVRICHWNMHGTHLAHYLYVRDPLSSAFADLVRQNREDKVSRFGQRLSDQEGPWLVFHREQLLGVGPWQVTVVPPEIHAHLFNIKMATCVSCRFLACEHCKITLTF